MSTTDDSLAARYGAPSRARRVGRLALAVGVVVAFLGWLAWAILFHSNPEISSEEIGHEILDDHTATIQVRIQMDDDLVDPRCSLRAISHDKAVVGETTYVPDPGKGQVQDIEVRTDRRATTVEWLGCKADGQPRYR